MKKHLFPLSMILANLLMWAITYPRMSNQVPIHWSFSGEVDRYASKTEAMLTMMALLVFMYILMILTPKIDPRRKNYQLFAKTYHLIINAMLLIFSLINLLLVMTGLGYDLPTGSIVPVLVGALLIVIGNYLPRVRSNFFFGIKNPWTLSSDAIWKKTHRFAAKVFTAAGLLIAANGLFSLSENLILPIILLTVFAPYLYSYMLFRKENGMNG
ncbi:MULTISPECIES: SdpI family protein [Bacillus]|uniref:SdpI family protein n=1 Tax=Bacillus TaxID=1386 RepID=UPI00041F5A12|nr:MULTISPECIES: SdpI family protein [Bacillus]QHZ48300.1 SdpI family protein [Bacillus sp. NSP9.1]WFA06037.1 SdpI family protein [Bacillus sp. HSf4]